MKRLLVPDSLFGRLVTALLVVVVITVAVLALLIMRERREVAFWGSDSSDVIELMAQTTEDLGPVTAASMAVASSRVAHTVTLADRSKSQQLGRMILRSRQSLLAFE